MHDTEKPAPGELLLIEQFVNTLDTEEGTDALDGAWPLSAGLSSTELGAGDVERLARRVRALSDRVEALEDEVDRLRRAQRST